MIAEVHDLDAILAKVQKLLNVQGRTPEEAALYVEQAHAILAKYDLSIESVHKLTADPRTSVRKADAGTRTVRGKPDGWKADVLEAVAVAFECRVIWAYEAEEAKSGRYRSVKVGNLVGFGHDVEAAGYANAFVVAEITRLAKEYARPMWEGVEAQAKAEGVPVHTAESWYVQDTGRHPLKAELYFIRGAAEAVGRALEGQARQRRTVAVEVNPNALVVQKAAEVTDFIYRERYGKSKAEHDASMAETRARWAEERERQSVKPETEAQRRKREEREERANYRYQQAANNRYWREEARKDHEAITAGREAGGNIRIRFGVGSGTRGEEKLHD